MTKDDWESEERAVFIRLLEDSDVAVDIGANVGFYSCLAAKMGKHVIAFEPSNRNLQLLKQNLWNNGCRDVEIFPMGLASRCGLSEMYGFGGMASLVRGWAQSDTRHAELISTTTLDTILDGRFIGEKLLIKVDVEGFELEVLKGATHILRREPRPAWLVEIMLVDDLIPGGINPRFLETFKCFWSFGYECTTLDGRFDTVTPEDLDRWINREPAGAKHNYLFRGSS